MIKVVLLFPVDTPRVYSSRIKLEKRMATKYAQLQLVCPVITSCPCRTNPFSKWESNCSRCHLYTHIIALRAYNFVFTSLNLHLHMLSAAITLRRCLSLHEVYRTDSFSFLMKALKRNLGDKHVVPYINLSKYTMFIGFDLNISLFLHINFSLYKLLYIYLYSLSFE